MLFVDLNDMDSDDQVLNSDYREMKKNDQYVDSIDEMIRQQYREFDNLGVNLLEDYKNELTDDGKIRIFNSMAQYVNERIIPYGDLENISGDPNRLLIAGDYLYQFICVDCVSVLIPALMENLGCTCLEDFDKIINMNYSSNIGKFKSDFLNIIQMTINQLLKLQKITENVKNDGNYQKLLGKYYYYQEIVDYGDSEMFLNSFIRPVLSKYAETIVWKLI